MNQLLDKVTLNGKAVDTGQWSAAAREQIAAKVQNDGGQPVYQQDLMRARALFATGDGCYKGGCEYLLKAQAAGASQREIAKAIGRSQAWVYRVLKWHAEGCDVAGPFAADHKRHKKRLAANHHDPEEDDDQAEEKKSDPELKKMLKDAEELLKAAGEQSEALLEAYKQAWLEHCKPLAEKILANDYRPPYTNHWHQAQWWMGEQSDKIQTKLHKDINTSIK
jgi:hypothetical protein